ncbi:protein piccolo-like [Thunnus albacares]|uniref:protein piccolo-like n=1 Tax=Thunnus albacares TaxID=8236 RepID=UPI001CF65219|nr:protein piccolo-like [Thunnus albacares]
MQQLPVPAGVQQLPILAKVQQLPVPAGVQQLPIPAGLLQQLPVPAGPSQQLPVPAGPSQQLPVPAGSSQQSSFSIPELRQSLVPELQPSCPCPPEVMESLIVFHLLALILPLSGPQAFHLNFCSAPAQSPGRLPGAPGSAPVRPEAAHLSAAS